MDIFFDISEILSTVVCPNCGALFLASYGKRADFFEGTPSACPYCKLLYIFGASGLDECSYEEGEKPEDFIWSNERCLEYRESASNHYGSNGTHSFVDNKDIVGALRYINQALAICPEDERHYTVIREMLDSEFVKKEWIEAAKKNPEYKCDTFYKNTMINYHKFEIERDLKYLEQKFSVQTAHIVVDQLLNILILRSRNTWNI